MKRDLAVNPNLYAARANSVSHGSKTLKSKEIAPLFLRLQTLMGNRLQSLYQLLSGTPCRFISYEDTNAI